MKEIIEIIQNYITTTTYNKRLAAKLTSSSFVPHLSIDFINWKMQQRMDISHSNSIVVSCPTGGYAVLQNTFHNLIQYKPVQMDVHKQKSTENVMQKSCNGGKEATVSSKFQ